MRTRNSFRYMILILIALFFAACSDEDPASPEPGSDILLTIHFGDFSGHFYSEEGIVFASDATGNVLDVATWSGTSTVVLRNSLVHPPRVSFTLFQHSERSLRFTTELGVRAGSVRTFANPEKLPVSGYADITFQNVPDCWQYRMAYNLRAVHGWDLFPSQRRIEIPGTSTDLFVRVDPVDSAPIGAWLRDLRPDDSDTLDFDLPGVAIPLTENVVRIPTDGAHVGCFIAGILDTDPTQTPLDMEYLGIDETIPETITLYSPDLDPSKLISTYYQENGGYPQSFFWQESRGAVPTSFTNLEGDLTVTSTSPDGLAFSTTSQWDRFVAGWYQKEELSSIWWVEGPAPVQSFVLPQLPAEIADLYPDCPRGDFELLSLEIYQNTTDDLVRTQGRGFYTGKDEEGIRLMLLGSPLRSRAIGPQRW